MSSQRQPRERYVIGDLELDVGRVRVTRGNQELSLPPLSFRLLLELCRAAPDVVSPGDLLERVWAGVVVNEETLKQRVKLLRQALGESGREPRYVRTVRGVGYELIPAVRVPRHDPRETDGVESHASVGPGRVGRLWWLRRLLKPLGLGAAALTGAALLLALAVDLTTRPAPAAARSPATLPAVAPDSAEALYQVGRTHFQRRGEQSLRQAQTAFRKAAAADPAYAAAWAGLSDATLMLLLYGDADRDGTLEEARGYLSRAEAAGGDQAVVRTSLGLLAWTEGRTGEAEALFGDALAMDKTNELAGLWLGILRLRAGKPESARALLNRVRALAPLDPVVLANLGEAHMSLGEYDTGMKYLSLAAQAAPDQGLLALRAVDWSLEYGRLAEADAWLRHARALGGDPHGALAALRARTRITAGDPAGARAILETAGLGKGSPDVEAGPTWAVATKRLATLQLALAEGGTDTLAGRWGVDSARAVEGWSHEWAGALYLAGDFPGVLRVYDGPPRRIGADLGPLERAWVHVSLAVAHARLGHRGQSGIHARVAADSRLAHGGHEPRAHVLSARLAALRGQESRMFAALEEALAAGWMDAGLLDQDPVFRPFREGPRFAALRDRLEARMRDARQALGSRDSATVKVASASGSPRGAPGRADAGHR